jgi:hypothetical protein
MLVTSTEVRPTRFVANFIDRTSSDAKVARSMPANSRSLDIGRAGD